MEKVFYSLLLLICNRFKAKLPKIHRILHIVMITHIEDVDHIPTAVYITLIIVMYCWHTLKTEHTISQH